MALNECLKIEVRPRPGGAKGPSLEKVIKQNIVCTGLYRVYSQISIAWNKHNGAAFSNSEHSDLIFLPNFFLKKTQLSSSPNSTRRHLFKTGVDMPVGAWEPSEMKTPEIPQRKATSKIADAYSRVNPVITCVC